MTDPRIITISIRSVYGAQTIYPACPQAALFARIAGTKTLTPAALDLIEQLGFTVQVEAPQVTVGGRRLAMVQH